MSLGAKVRQLDDRAATETARKIAFVMAVSSTLLAALYLLGLVGKLVVDGTVHSLSSQSVQMASAIIAILLNLALLIMFAALRWCISGRNEVFADLALVLMTLVCATSSINWFVQLTVCPRITPGNDSNMLALVDVHSSSSVMYAIEHLGWGVFYGLAAVSIAIAIDGGRLENWIRWLFLAGGALSILHVCGIVMANPAIADLGYLAWGVLLPATTTLIAIRLGRD
jgi:hypothetical protein